MALNPPFGRRGNVSQPTRQANDAVEKHGSGGRRRVSDDAWRTAAGASVMTHLIANSRGSGNDHAWRTPCNAPRSPQ